jgi:Domain of unknown function (DUF4367)
MKKYLATSLLMSVVAGTLMLTPGFSQAALANTAATTVDSNVQQINNMGMTAEEAVKKAGFPVKLPSYVPEGVNMLTINYAEKLSQVSISYTSFKKPSFYLGLRKGSLDQEASSLGEKAEIQLVHGKGYIGKMEKSDVNTVIVWEDQGVIYRLFGAYSADELTKIANSVGVGTPPAVTPAISMSEPESVTREEASQKIGFPIKVPTYLPKGAELAFDYYKEKDREEVSVYNQISGLPFLSMRIQKGDLKKEAYQDSDPKTVREVSVNGSLAYVRMVPGHSFSDPDLREFTKVTFEVGPGEIYDITSSLPLEEIVKIAESLK